MTQQFTDEGCTPATGILWDWQIIAALQENIKPEQVSARPDGKDYVEWHEATRIANCVFGPLGWSLTTTMTPTFLGLGDWGEGFFCTRKITVRYRCSEDKEVYTIERDGEGWIKLQAIGKGDAIDMAFKGAASDAISKATKTFGDAFGLNLYTPKGRHTASTAPRTLPRGQQAAQPPYKVIYDEGVKRGAWTRETFYATASGILDGFSVNANNVKALSQAQLQKLQRDVERYPEKKAS